jgi:hypothetical protein
MGEEDKRKADRASKKLEVHYITGADQTAITSNISETGIFIITNNKVAPGTVLDLTLHLPGLQNFSLKGRVVRNKYTAPALVGEATSGLGVELMKPPQEYINYIRSLLN